jgi:hypothetical protein
MPCRTQPHQPDSSPPPVAVPAALTSLWKEGSWEQAEAHRWLFTRSGTAGALHQNSNTLGAGCKVAQEPGHLPGIVQPVLGGKLTPANKATRTADEAVRLLSGSGVMGSGLVVNRPREAESLGVGASSTCWAGAESRASVTATGQVWTYAACLMPQTSCHA